VAPNAVNSAVASVPCAAGPSGSGGADGGRGAGGKLRPLRVVMHFHGHRQLRVTVLHAAAKRVAVTARRGKHVLVTKRLRTKHGIAHLRIAARKRGLYRVTALDPGPPPRSAQAQRRVR
jgi:hypothetical protein